MKVLILAAGYGTRLYPLITDTSKSLLDIAGKPLINYSMDKIRVLDGLNEVIVVTNNKFYGDFLKWSQDNGSFGVPIKIINDGTMSPDDRLGSIGDISFVLKNHIVDDDLLVIGGDNLFDYSLEESIIFAQSNNSNVTIGLYDIGDLEGAKKFGVVEIDQNGGVVSFEEKPEKPKSSLIAMCFYYFPKETLGLIDKYISESSKTDKAGDYIHWLVEKSSVFGFKFEGKWYDIGSIEAYNEAQEKFKK